MKFFSKSISKFKKVVGYFIQLAFKWPPAVILLVGKCWGQLSISQHPTYYANAASGYLMVIAPFLQLLKPANFKSHLRPYSSHDGFPPRKARKSSQRIYVCSSTLTDCVKVHYAILQTPAPYTQPLYTTKQYTYLGLTQDFPSSTTIHVVSSRLLLHLRYSNHAISPHCTTLYENMPGVHGHSQVERQSSFKRRFTLRSV
jgi:hypothetical protein